MTFVSMDSTGLTNWVRGDDILVDGRNVLQEGLYWLLIFVLPNAFFAVFSMILLHCTMIAFSVFSQKNWAKKTGSGFDFQDLVQK